MVVAVLGVLALLVPLGACSTSSDEGDDGAGGADDAGAPTTTTGAEPDLDTYCARLRELVDDDPFTQIFGNDDPMDAAAVFDRGRAQLDALVEAAPDDLRAPADAYREVLAGYRDLILPSTTLDAETYQQRFAELRAEQDAARAEFDAQLAERCADR